MSWHRFVAVMEASKPVTRCPLSLTGRLAITLLAVAIVVGFGVGSLRAPSAGAATPDALDVASEPASWSPNGSSEPLLSATAPQKASAAPSLEIVRENPNFFTHAVDGAGVAYGTSRNTSLADYRSALYRSFDEGATWQRRFVFPGRILEISVLSNDTLIAHVGRGSFTLWRSNDGGASWAQTFVFPSGYRTLGPHSVTDDHEYVYVGSYCGCSAAANTNWVWRSGDDGRTWQVVQTTTTHRHIHFVRANPYDGRVYVGFGDSQAGSGIDVSSNHGATWRTLCTGHVCKAVDIDFNRGGFAVYGMDVGNAIPYIRKLNLTTGTTTIVGQLSCPSFSSINLGAGVWLLGEARTGSGTVCSKADNRMYLWGSNDRGNSFTKVYSRIKASSGGTNLMTVNFAFPNGDFPIQVSGYGTIVGRLN